VGAITISTTSADARRALELAVSHPDLWCTAGVHPLYSDQPVEWEALREVGLHPKCVGWGELGLDRHYYKPPQAKQRAVLDQQLEWLVEWSGRDPRLDKPVVVHCREAFDELVPILRASGLPPHRFVFHCFTAGPREMELLLEFGAWVSFTGVVTFANAKETREAARIAPAGRVMVETDSPFLTPEPHRKVRPNEPRFVVHVADALAELWDRPNEEVRRELDANARRFFKLDSKVL
jgi:TatD DNase family protein